MKKSPLAAALVSLALLPSPASAGAPKPTMISPYDAVNTAQGTLIYGVVESSSKCIRARTIELFRNDGNKPVYDVDITSKRGAFAVLFQKGDNPNSLSLRVLKSEAGSTTCGKSTVGIIL